MAYVIRPRDQFVDDNWLVALTVALEHRLRDDGRFTARVGAEHQSTKRVNVVLREVRLTAPKVYCGQHAGPCDLPQPFKRPKRKMHLLEWFDWVEFNGLVNDVLDASGLDADVWSTPPDTRLDRGKKLWVRRGVQRRHRWDFEKRVVCRGLCVFAEYVADHGSPSQFIPPGGVMPNQTKYPEPPQYDLEMTRRMYVIQHAYDAGMLEVPS